MSFYSKIFNKILFEKKYLLTSQSIDEVSADIEGYQEKLGIHHADMVKLRLRLELLLLSYLEADSSFENFTLMVYTKFNRVYIRIDIAGDCFNYRKIDMNGYCQALTAGINTNALTESYSYLHGMNAITLRLPKRSSSPLLYIIAALASGVLTGVIFSLFPPEVGQAVSNSFFDPLFDVIIGLLKMISSLMVFFAVVSGICSLGDINSFSRQGRVVLSRCFRSTAESVVITTAICLLLFNITNEGQEFPLSEISFLINTILGMIPLNAVTPFTEGNAMQILFLAVGVGVLILINSERTAALVENIKQINIVIMTGVTTICKLAPLIIYLSISVMILTDSLGSILDAWKIPALIMVASLFAIGVTFFRLARQLHRPFFQLVRENLPIGLIGLSTSSSSACTNKIIELCRDEYNLPAEKTTFYFPMLQMFLKPGVALPYAAFIYVMCAENDITVPLATIIINILIITLMSMAVAPVPGGDIPIAVILIASAGLPDETVAIYTAIAFILDMLCTGIYCLQYAPEIAAIDKKTCLDGNVTAGKA